MSLSRTENYDEIKRKQSDSSVERTVEFEHRKTARKIFLFCIYLNSIRAQFGQRKS